MRLTLITLAKQPAAVAHSPPMRAPQVHWVIFDPFNKTEFCPAPRLSVCQLAGVPRLVAWGVVGFCNAPPPNVEPPSGGFAFGDQTKLSQELPSIKYYKLIIYYLCVFCTNVTQTLRLNQCGRCADAQWLPISE